MRGARRRVAGRAPASLPQPQTSPRCPQPPRERDEISAPISFYLAFFFLFSFFSFLSFFAFFFFFFFFLGKAGGGNRDLNEN